VTSSIRKFGGAISAAPILLLLSFVLMPACENLPTGPARNWGGTKIKGMTLVDWTADGYGSSQALASVDDIALLGANTLTIVVTAYQTDQHASHIRIDAQRTPTRQSVAAVILRAQSLPSPQTICIKLHVDVDNGVWRGTIEPSDPAAWFADYSAFVVTWAVEAEAAGVQQLVIGNELAGTLRQEDRWRALIQEVRSVYTGVIIYAASWDEAPKVPFWDAVDLAGINFYAPVSQRDDPHRMDLLRGWQPWIERIRLVHKLARRDILISEIGYRSVNGAGRHPYDFATSAAVDLQEQADLYWAALEVLSDKPWIRGVYWWNWLARGNPQEELSDYTPKGKPAAMELSNAW
jgi:hypothetical protein